MAKAGRTISGSENAAGHSGATSLRLSANLGMLFPELSLPERVDAAAAAGFEAVEFHVLAPEEALALAPRLMEAGLQVVALNASPGGPGELGLAAIEGAEGRFEASLLAALDAAEAVGAGAVHVLAGRREPTEALDRQLDRAARAYARAAESAAARGLAVLIEPLCPQAAPRYLLSCVEEVAALIARAGHPALRILFDLFHVEMEGGHALERLNAVEPLVGHVQIAGVPDRHEPVGGLIDGATILPELAVGGYSGWVGCEWRPRGRTMDGLAWARPFGIAVGPQLRSTIS